MEEQNPERFLKRRAFLADIAAAGAVVVGSAVWAMSTRTVDASPAATPSAKGSKSPGGGKTPTPVPRETDHLRLDGDVAPPVTPSPKARATAKPSPSPPKNASGAPPPRELDTVPLAGKPAASPPPRPSPTPSPKPH